MGVRGKVIAVALALVALWPAAAGAYDGIDHGLAPDGNPGLTYSSDQGARQWWVCPPQEACRSLGVTQQQLQPGSSAAGTTWELRDDQGASLSPRVLSKPWKGTLATDLPPRLQGELKVGQRVHAVPGTWTGGWEGDRSSFTIEACEGPDAQRCEGAGQAVETCVNPPSQGIIDVGSRYAGWWLRAVEVRVTGDTAFPAYCALGPTYPFTQPSAVVSKGPLAGPVQPGASHHPQAPQPDPPPRATLFRRARSVDGRIRVGTIHCAVACRVRVSVSDGRRTAIRTRTISGRAQLTTGRRPKLRRGKRLRVRVSVDGRLVASGRVAHL